MSPGDTVSKDDIEEGLDSSFQPKQDKANHSGMLFINIYNQNILSIATRSISLIQIISSLSCRISGDRGCSEFVCACVNFAV